MNSNDVVEIAREAAELACQNLQRVLNETLDYTKSFEWNEISESLLINHSAFVKSKRIRENEDDELGYFKPLKQWEQGKEEEKEDQKEEEEEEEEEEDEEEEEEEEEVEPPFPPHPSMYGGFTWESIAESLSQGKLPSRLYKELPHDVYFTFRVYILEGHRRYLKNEVHLSCKKIDESDEMLESFVPLADLLTYCYNNDYNYV
jgi:cobalamin biosynthesis protein CobT